MNEPKHISNNKVMNDNTLIKEALIEWIERHSEEERLIPYIASAKGRLTLDEISKEVKSETEIGIEVIKNITYLTVDLLARGKETLPNEQTPKHPQLSQQEHPKGTP